MEKSDFSKHRKVEVTIRAWSKEKKKEKREESSSSSLFRGLCMDLIKG